MRFNVYSPHWADGGTGITNFGLASLALYDEVVRRYVEKTGDRSYIVCDVAMGGNYTGQKIKDTMGSLHRADAARREGHDCSEFWKVFAEVNAERRALEAAAAEKKRIEELAAVKKAALEQEQRIEAAQEQRQRAFNEAVANVKKHLEARRALEAENIKKAKEALWPTSYRALAEARIRMIREMREENLRAGASYAAAFAEKPIIEQEKLHVRLGRWHVTLVVDADGKLHVKSELLTDDLFK